MKQNEVLFPVSLILKIQQLEVSTSKAAKMAIQEVPTSAIAFLGSAMIYKFSKKKVGVQELTEAVTKIDIPGIAEALDVFLRERPKKALRKRKVTEEPQVSGEDGGDEDLEQNEADDADDNLIEPNEV